MDKFEESRTTGKFSPFFSIKFYEKIFKFCFIVVEKKESFLDTLWVLFCFRFFGFNKLMDDFVGFEQNFCKTFFGDYAKLL